MGSNINLHPYSTDTCECHYEANAESNRRWCCGDVPHFDLSYWAFAGLNTARAPESLGVVGVQFRRVPCAPDPAIHGGNISLRVVGVNPEGGWLKLVPLNTGGLGVVTGVSVRCSPGTHDDGPSATSGGGGGDGGVERRLARVWEGSAAWEASGLPRACPLGVRLDMEGGGAALVAPDALGPLKHLRQGQEVDTGCQDHPVLRPPDTQ